MRILKNIGLHTAGVILGILVDAISYGVLYFILIECLGSVPFIANLLSYPVEYSWYATVLAMTVPAFLGIYACSAMCKLSKTKYKYGLIVFGLIYTIDYILRIIESFSENGFSFSVLIMYLICIGVYSIGSLYSAFLDE